MRDGYGKALLELCRLHDNVIVMDADVAKSTRTDWVRTAYPQKYLNVGISEQDLVGTAAGMSLTGFVPFVSTYGVFLTGRAWEQIRNTVGYNRLNVKLGGAHAGISVGPDGGTHQALEDVALMRTIPNIMVVVPCDYKETYKATMAVYDMTGPSYIRFSRNPVPVVTDDDTPFTIGKVSVFRKGTDVTIFANGIMVYQSLEAASIRSSLWMKTASYPAPPRREPSSYAKSTSASAGWEALYANAWLSAAACLSNWSAFATGSASRAGQTNCWKLTA